MPDAEEVVATVVVIMEPVLPVHILPRHDNPIQYPCHSLGRWKYHPVGVPTDLDFYFFNFFPYPFALH